MALAVRLRINGFVKDLFLKDFGLSTANHPICKIMNISQMPPWRYLQNLQSPISILIGLCLYMNDSSPENPD